MKEGKVPEDWKSAQVSPIFKKGSRTSAGNYRPVALTCVLCKVMESIIRDKLLVHFESNNLFTVHQHGFTSRKSCLTNLLETFEDWTSALDNGYNIDTIFLDYQKAFDTVPHKRLVCKLKAYGIQGNLLDWIESFLVKRRMRVGVRGQFSDWCSVDSGVPQGSVLGPILFLVYVNDIPEMVDCKLKMFADDTKIWNSVKNMTDNMLLQEDLDKLSEWSKIWLLKFHVGKCKRMHIGRTNAKFEYSMKDGDGRRILEEVDEEKDIGVWISNNMKPTKQCIRAALKATNVMRSVKKSFSYIDKEAFLILYKTFIRPHLEFCVQAWSPYYKKDIAHLERVQRRATKLVIGLYNKSYEERLRVLGLQSLELRRTRGDLIETYKIMTGKERVDSEIFFKQAGTTSLRGNSMKLFKGRSRLLVRQNFFSQRVVNAWNNLPESVISAETTNNFKNRIDRYMLDMGDLLG